MDVLFEYRPIIRGVFAPPVNESYAPVAGGKSLGEETVDEHFGFVNGVPVQIELRLNGVIAAVQALHEAPVDTRCDTFHIFVGVLDDERAASFDESTELIQGRFVVRWQGRYHGLLLAFPYPAAGIAC
jgi:hypothetical protein